MTTIGLRGFLAAGFLLSTGMMTGMASGPGEPLPAPALGFESAQPGSELSLISRIKLRSCVVSLGAKRHDAAHDRRAQCQDRIAARQ